MPAGRLRLAATAGVDAWITGDATHSHFLQRFKRHTKFAIETVETPVDGRVDFGGEVSCRVPVTKGDLIRNVALKIVLSDPTPDSPGKNDVYWTPSVISHLIEHADLLIGGQTVQRLTGEYIYMHQQLNNSFDDVDLSVYFLNGHGNFLRYSNGTYTYYMDLPFYFYRESSLAIPVCALTKQLVEVRIKLRPLNELIWYTTPADIPSGLTAKIANMSLDSEFVYVTPEERAYFMHKPISYAITQLQMSQFKIPAGETERSVMLKFTGPVKEMFFTSTSDRAVELNTPYDFNTIQRVRLRFNDEVVFDKTHKQLVYEQSLRNHVNSPLVRTTTMADTRSTTIGAGGAAYSLKSDFGMFSFAEYPDRAAPSGQVNFSRITHKLLTVNIDHLYAGHPSTVRVYAVSYNILTIAAGLAGVKF
jgi:hypothetical protein